jgi:uncharacterized protein YgiM (DUF1202 family)
MQKFKKFVFLLILPIFLSSCSLKKQKMAALTVTSSPKAGVFINGEHIGSTPYYDDKLQPGDYTLKIISEANPAAAWEASVKLNAGIVTVVSRELAEVYDDTSGHILNLEPSIDKEDTTLLVITHPEKAVITIDGQSRGFTPIAIDDLEAGDHIILISSPGYIEKSIKARLEKGYKLNANIQLAKSNQIATLSNSDKESEDEAEEELITKEDEEKVLDADLDIEEAPEEEVQGQDLKPSYVTIQDTDTGWLNVRQEPTTSSEIIKKVYPGDSFAYLDLNKAGWYQIQLDADTEGWISSKYAKLTKE